MLNMMAKNIIDLFPYLNINWALQKNMEPNREHTGI